MQIISGVYKHYKGGKYLVLGIAEHTETEEKLIVYVSLDATQPGSRLRVRPFDSFFDLVLWPDNERHCRFVWEGDVE